MTTARTRALRLFAAPLVVGALVFGSIAPAQADGRGPGPGQGGPATAEPVMTTMLSGNVAALTFDDGPNPETASACWRSWRQTKPRRSSASSGSTSSSTRRGAADRAAGHTLCNHSMYHTRGIGAWSAERLRADMEETSAAIREAVGGVPVPYYRVPYGFWGLSAQVAAKWGCSPSAPPSRSSTGRRRCRRLAERLETQLRQTPGSPCRTTAQQRAATTDRAHGSTRSGSLSFGRSWQSTSPPAALSCPTLERSSERSDSSVLHAVAGTAGVPYRIWERSGMRRPLTCPRLIALGTGKRLVRSGTLLGRRGCYFSFSGLSARC